MPVYAIEDLIPVIKSNSYVHPSAEIIGDVIIEEHCYIGPNAVLRGDFGTIHVHHHSNIQDNCVLHSFPNYSAILKPFSHVGHGAILHGCTVEENALIGINAVIMDEAIIGSESIVAASSFVRAKFTCPPRSMVMGTPAKIIKTLTEEEVKWKTSGTNEYVELAKRSLESMRLIEALTDVQPDRPSYQDSNHPLKS
ncbi:MAG: phenylacetic acid degradation protein PaaY [Gammaproteobacteria bacterium]|nr:MAG: phenylacetic acid degradation protein PaaY [Gammaproteobacteria bacterium]